MNELKILGTISRSHGLKGSSKVNLHRTEIPVITKDEPVFIQLQGGPVPFFIEEFKQVSKSIVLLTVEDIDAIEKADKLVGAEVFLESEKFVDMMADADDTILNFMVIDKERGEIGSVCGIIETAQHPVLEVSFNKSIILIPWVDAIVKEIDEEAHTIKVEAPDGLIDLYLNG